MFFFSSTSFCAMYSEIEISGKRHYWMLILHYIFVGWGLSTLNIKCERKKNWPIFVPLLFFSVWSELLQCFGDGKRCEESVKVCQGVSPFTVFTLHTYLSLNCHKYILTHSYITKDAWYRKKHSYKKCHTTILFYFFHSFCSCFFLLPFLNFFFRFCSRQWLDSERGNPPTSSSYSRKL